MRGVMEIAITPAALTAGAFIGTVRMRLDWRSGFGLQRPTSKHALIFTAAFAALVYPVAEELFFRGFLLGVVTRTVGPIAGIVATAALFTALHSLQRPSLGTLQIFADGLFFAFVRLRSGSLILPVAFHVLGNSIAVMQRLS